ncbi:MAG: hypothetical protein ACSW8G_01835 [Bacillota bacterium]
MTSAKSCKNPEMTWFAEMLRRFKVLPLLIAIAYFLSNILPIILSYSTLENVISYVNDSMTGQNVFNICIGIVGGIAVSVAVFRYLHSTDSVIDAHSKPMTRTQLFRGSFSAGLIMVIAPVVLTGLFYLCMMGAHGSVDLTKFVQAQYLDINVNHLLCASNIIGWTLDNIVVIGFTYCVACFAGILAGTSVIHALLSLLLIFLGTIVNLLVTGYAQAFLYGYDGNVVMDFSGYLSPYVYIMWRGKYPFESVPITLIVCAAVSVILVFAAAAIYKRIRLEKAEQSIVVPYVADFLVILLTAIAASTSLFIARSFLSVETQEGSIITIILATMIFFPIFCMIAEQSLRIFKKRNIGVLAVYAAVIGLVLAFTLFDVTGYHLRVPEVSDIESVTIHDDNLYHMDMPDVNDEETLALITDLHRSIAETGIQVTDNDDVSTADGNRVVQIAGFEVRYKLKNGKTLSRYYWSIYENSFDEYAAFYDSKQVRKHECIDEENPVLSGQYMSLRDTHVDDRGDWINENEYLVQDKDVDNLVRAANKDIMNWTAENRGLFDYSEDYDPAKDDSAYMLSINTDYRIPADKQLLIEDEAISYPFTEKDKNICKFIKEHPEYLSADNIIQPNDPILGDYED